MRNKFELVDYETVTPSPGQRSFSSRDTEDNALQIYASEPNVVANAIAKSHERLKSVSATRSANSQILTKKKTPFSDGWTIKRGHSLSYLCLFVFTCLVIQKRPHGRDNYADSIRSFAACFGKQHYRKTA